MTKSDSKFPGIFKLSKGRLTAEHIEDILNKGEEFKRIRGSILESSIYVEHKLDEIISNCLFDKNNKKSILFKEIFLEKEFFTFMQKFRTLKSFFKTNLIKLKVIDYQKELFSLILKIIEDRNKFVHGMISFVGTTLHLEYLREGKKEKIKIDEVYLKNLKYNFDKAIELLDKVEIP